jgi:hypothetical protein
MSEIKAYSKLIPLPYDDPQNFDGKPEETAKYDKRCRQIAREMVCVFSQVRADSSP